MWHGHLFSQKNMSKERPVGVGVGGDREVEVGGGIGDKTLRMQGDIGNTGGLHKIMGVSTPLPTI